MSEANGVTVRVESSTVMADDHGRSSPGSHDIASSHLYRKTDNTELSSTHDSREIGAVEDSTAQRKPSYQQFHEHRPKGHSKEHISRQPDYTQQYLNSIGGGGGAGAGDGYSSPDSTVTPPPVDTSRTTYPPLLPQQYPMVFNQGSFHSSAANLYAYPVGLPVLHNSPPMMLQFLPGQPIPRYTDLESTHSGLHMPWQQKVHAPESRINQSIILFDPGPPIQLTPDEHGPVGCNLFVFHLPNVKHASFLQF
jgi:hypothetical protein